MSVDPGTARVYAARAGEYAEMTAKITQDPTLAAFIGDLPAGGQVLDLGCGPGAAAAAMARAGLRVDATDAVAEMVAMAATHPGVRAWQATFDDITGEAVYDGVWANFSLLHASRSALPRHLAALRRALRRGGLFHIGMKTGRGAARDSLGRHYTYVTQEELWALLEEADLMPVSVATGADTGLDGIEAPWVTITAHG